MRTLQPAVSRTLAILTIVGGVALLVGAHVVWSMASAAPGERSFSPALVGAAQAGAAALALLAHAALLGVAMPLLYRPRATYAAVAIAGGLLATIAGVTSAALFASTH